MNRSLRGVLAIVTVALVTGCAGTNFKRPDPQSLQIGKSTTADVVRVMGNPPQTGEGLVQEQKVKYLRYAYAEGAGEGLHPGVVPARAMVFTAFNDQLVAEEFISSFKQDATDFDESKLASIVKGRTTRAEVQALLGKPNGEAIYPIVKERGQKAMLYTYAQAKGSVFNMKFYNKTLVVALTPADIVADLQYTANGER